MPLHQTGDMLSAPSLERRITTSLRWMYCVPCRRVRSDVSRWWAMSQMGCESGVQTWRKWRRRAPMISGSTWPLLVQSLQEEGSQNHENRSSSADVCDVQLTTGCWLTFPSDSTGVALYESAIQHSYARSAQCGTWRGRHVV